MSAEPAYPLIDAYPRLAALPRAGLLRAPTPVQALPDAGDTWVKRDDRSTEEFGGNKIRKLDLLLGDALARNRRSLLAFGYSGSNFVAATAWHGHRLGLRTLGLLLPQVDAPYVADNLAMARAAGAELIVRSSEPALLAAAVRGSLARLLRDARWPYWMPPGGSTPLGALGYVNAALELRQQIERGECPLPQRVYVAFSSMGTVAGLAVGLALAGLGARIQAIQVVGPRYAGRDKLDALIGRTQRLLRHYDPGIPPVAVPVDIRTEHRGPRYAVPSPAAQAAMQRFIAASGARSDSAYTGKALAGLYADVDAGLPGTALYWHSFNAHGLPPGLRPLQPTELAPFLAH
ncbi:MAG TPA: pyridoxal-phosphate dependent enzyme [Solimonas sp.]